MVFCWPRKFFSFAQLAVRLHMIIKTYHSSGICCFSYDSILYERIEDKIREVHKLAVPFKLFYKDIEGDWVRLASDDDVSFALAYNGSSLLRIRIVEVGNEAGKETPSQKHFPHLSFAQNVF